MSLSKLVTKTLAHVAREGCFKLPAPYDDANVFTRDAGDPNATIATRLPVIRPRDQRRFYSECIPNWDPNQIVKKR